MRIPLRLALALGAAGVLAACTDEPTSAPTAPSPRATVPAGPNLLTLNDVSCDVTQLKTDARDYASKGGDPLLAIIGDIPNALKLDAAVSGGPVPGPNATDKAFDALARIGVIRGTSDMKLTVTKTVFNRLVKSLLKCAQKEVWEGAKDLPTDGFGGAIGNNWVFEVRGKSTDGLAAPAWEKGSSDNTYWGMWPDQASWEESIESKPTSHRVLVYGYRTSFSKISGLVGSTFEHRTIPMVQKTSTSPALFKLDATLGLCATSASSLTITDKMRINHDKVFLELPLLEDRPSCTPGPLGFTPATATLAALGALPMRAVQRAASLFWPQSLYAATMFGGGSVTGSPDDFSPSAVYDLSAFKVSQPGSVTTIANGNTSTTLHLTNGGDLLVDVKVVDGNTLVTAPDGTPVILSILGNKSNIAFFNVVGTADSVATVTHTTVGGQVNFSDVKMTKAGGYQLQIFVAFDGVAGVNAIATNSFQIQNK